MPGKKPKIIPKSQQKANHDGGGTDSTLSTPSPGTMPSAGVNIPGKTHHHHHSHQRVRRVAVVAEETEDNSVSESPPTAASSVSNHNVQLSEADLDEISDHPGDLPCSPPIGGIVGANASWPTKMNWASADSGYGGDYTLSVAGVNNASTVVGRSQSMRSTVGSFYLYDF